MARGIHLGRRSRVDPAGRANRRPFGGTNIRPRTEVPIRRAGALFARDESPVGLRIGFRRGRRRGRRGRRR
jgi:hypothetical protein